MQNRCKVASGPYSFTSPTTGETVSFSVVKPIGSKNPNDLYVHASRMLCTAGYKKKEIAGRLKTAQRLEMQNSVINLLPIEDREEKRLYHLSAQHTSSYIRFSTLIKYLNKKRKRDQHGTQKANLAAQLTPIYNQALCADINATAALEAATGTTPTTATTETVTPSVTTTTTTTTTTSSTATTTTSIVARLATIKKRKSGHSHHHSLDESKSAINTPSLMETTTTASSSPLAAPTPQPSALVETTQTSPFQFFFPTPIRAIRREDIPPATLASLESHTKRRKQ